MKPAEFIAAIAPAAVQCMKDTGVFASVTIAQAALESSWGSRALGNNLFGIKADKSWRGPTVTFGTHEVTNGAKAAIKDVFRAYPNWLASLNDHAGFIRSNKRYSTCFMCKDPEGFAQGLQRAGYATDPDYAQKLISIIRRYNLKQYDMKG